jgi:predicted ATPase/DNA-binding CsgD family transcriptional regulator
LAHSIPKAHHGLLQERTMNGTSSEPITIGTVEWYVWLEQHRSFCFETAHSTFTARKEKRPGGWYWYAYRRKQGKLHTAYLGKSEELTVERLNIVAATFEQSGEHNTSASLHVIPRLTQVYADNTLQGHQAAIVPLPTMFTGAMQLTKPEPVPQHNLPVQLTTLVGREQDAATVVALLRRPHVRLLNIIGTAGIGKTRLAIQVAMDLLDDFADGVYFVSLASIRSPHLVLSAIAQTLGLKEKESQPVAHLLQAYLCQQQILLVLDNFEQLVTAAPLLGELLAACSVLKLLVTSREVLHLRAEQQFAVPPLTVPNLEPFPAVVSLMQYAAVDLFIQRAQAVKHDFQLNEANAATIVEICIRLDGLPLAIELAAARIKVLSPQALLVRLDYRLQVLSDGAWDLPERQQTLRNTIQWSYNLLNAHEQRLFRRLSVFVGGSTLEAVEALYEILDDGEANVLEMITSLLDKSLLQDRRQGDGEQRLLILEMIREYGLDLLATSGEIAATHQAHALYYLTLVEGAEPEFWGPQQAVWFNRLEQERGNLRKALNWLLERGDVGKNIEMALRLGGALWWFWFRRAHFTEGAFLMERALAMAHTHVPVVVRAKALRCAGHLVDAQGDAERGEVLLAESVALFRESGNQVERGRTFFPFGMIAAGRGEPATARSRYEEGLAIAREAGDKLGIANLLHTSGNVARLQGEYARAYTLFEESAALFKELGNKGGIASSRLRLAELMFAQGEHRKVLALAEEALARHREMGDKARIAETLDLLGQLALQQGHTANARVYFEESLMIWKELNDQMGIVASLSLLAKIAAIESDQAAGKSLELAKDEGQKQEELKTNTAPPAGLTRREYEVLRLLTRGLTNVQIAEQLIVSLPTVNTHVRSIYNKLGVTSRSAATRYAFEHHLV